jgi:hypothetical protein
MHGSGGLGRVPADPGRSAEVVPVKEKMWRIQMTFKRQKEVPPGRDVTYFKAATAGEAIAVVKKVHKNEYGGVTDAKARIVS